MVCFVNAVAFILATRLEARSLGRYQRNEVSVIEPASRDIEILESVPIHLQYPACTLVFEFADNVGISDALGKIATMLALARAYNCALIPPYPHKMLNELHNLGRPVGKDVWWDRYLEVPRLMVKNVPETVWETSVTKLQRVPTREEMESMSMLTRYGNETALFQLNLVGVEFWTDILDQVHDALPKGRHPGRYFIYEDTFTKPSDGVIRSANKLLGNWTTTPPIGIYFRRGDRSGQYPEPCSSSDLAIEAIKFAQRSNIDEFGEARVCPKDAHAVFVATEEEDKDFLASLKKGLNDIGLSTVYLEPEVPQLQHLRHFDNYFAFFVDLYIAHLSGCFIYIHPANVDLLKATCLATDSSHSFASSPGRSMTESKDFGRASPMPWWWSMDFSPWPEVR